MTTPASFSALHITPGQSEDPNILTRGSYSPDQSNQGNYRKGECNKSPMGELKEQDSQEQELPLPPGESRDSFSEIFVAGLSKI